MALKDNWRGFWSSDNTANVNEDASDLSMTLVAPGLNGAVPTTSATGGKPNGYRIYNGTTSVDLVQNSNTNVSFSTGATLDVPFGWCCWIYVNAIGVAQFVFFKRVTGATPLAEWQVQISATGAVVFTLIGNTANTINISATSTTVLSANTWYHIAGDYDATKLATGIRIFINGVQDTVTPATVGAYTGMTASAVPLKIGASASNTAYSAFLNGRLDSIGVRAIIFAPGEPASLYNAGNGINPIVYELKDNWLAYWSSDNSLNEFANDAIGTITHTIITDATMPTLVSSGGRPGRYHTWDGTAAMDSRFTNSSIPMQFNQAGQDLPFTVTAWFNTNNNASIQTILGKRNGTVPAFNWQFTYSNVAGGFVFQFFGDSGGAIFIRGTAPFVPVNGTWYHIVATYDGSELTSGIKIYINGVSQTITPLVGGTYTGIFSTGAAVYIGMAKGAPNTNIMNGSLDGIGVRRGVMSQAEVTQLYNGGVGLSPFPALTANWVTWYNFDNNNGTEGTGLGLPLIQNGAAFINDPGKIGKAITITPTAWGETATGPPVLSFSSNDMSVCFWIYVPDATAGVIEGIMSKGVASPNREWFISHTMNWRIRFMTTNSTIYIGTTTTTNPVIVGAWQFVCITKDSTNTAAGIRIWHNGVLQAVTIEVSNIFTGMIPAPDPLVVGTSVGPATQRANGLYDMIGFRTQLLSQSDVDALYNAGNGLNLFPAVTVNTGAMMNFF